MTVWALSGVDSGTQATIFPKEATWYYVRVASRPIIEKSIFKVSDEEISRFLPLQ